MRKLATVSIALLLFISLVAPAAAGDAVTLQGEINCARCTLKEEGLTACQNVLVVKKDGEETHYWLTKNATNHEFGDVCMNSKVVQVTGQVEEKDGRMWLAASKIAPVENKG